MQKTITLHTPIARGKTTIIEITLTKPTVGALRGVKLVELVNGDVDSLMKVLPRVTTPTLNSNDVSNMDTVDFFELSLALISLTTGAETASDEAADEPAEDADVEVGKA